MKTKTFTAIALGVAAVALSAPPAQAQYFKGETVKCSGSRPCSPNG